MKHLSVELGVSKSNQNLLNVAVQCEDLLKQLVLDRLSVLRTKSEALLVTNRILLVNVENAAVCSAVDNQITTKGEKGESRPTIG